MGIFSRFERGMEDGLEGAAGKLFNAPITPVQISKKAERAMHREKMVGAGKQYAPTLYTVLVNAQDDSRLFGYYPTLAGETETYLSAKAAEEGFLMDGQPLVRFIVDEGLRRGKFDVVAELVSAPIIAQLRQEEMRRYGMATSKTRAPQPQEQQGQQADYAQSGQHNRYGSANSRHKAPAANYQEAAVPQSEPVPRVAEQPEVKQPEGEQKAAAKHVPLPYVPEEEIDRSIDYGEYTFNSQDWDSYQANGLAAQPVADIGSDNAEDTSDDDDFEHKTQSNPRNSLDLIPEISAPAPEPEASRAPETVKTADAPETFAATSNASDLSGLDVDAYDPSTIDSRGFGDSDNAPMGIPDTSVFANGSHGYAGSDYDIAEARLLNSAGTQSIDLASHRLILGRSSSCDIIIDDANASRNHAELRKESNGDWIISDLGSTNGTLVNGRRVTTRTLYEGDRIRIGGTDFIFTLR